MRRKRLGSHFATAALLATATWGCSGTPRVDTTSAEAKVSGSVRIRGKPMKGGEVSFDPSNSQRVVPARTAKVKDDGTYEVTTLQGRNSVTVSGPAIQKEPELAYGNQTVEVTSSTQTFDIDLPPK